MPLDCVLLSVPIFNRYKLHLFAKCILLSISNLAIFLYADLLGGQAGIQLLFIAMMSLPMILFDKAQNKSRILFLSTPIFLYFLLEFNSYHLISVYQLGPVENKVVFLAILICTIIINYLAIRFFYLSYQKSEESLLKVNTKLQTSNRRLSKHLSWTKKMLDRIRSQKAMEADLEKGRKLQNSTLPQTAPQMHNLTISHTFESAKSLSGDYFDYAPNHATATPIPTAHPQNDEDDDDTEPQFIFSQIGIIVADVVGKGVAASLEMFSVKTVFKLLHEHWFNPIELVTRLNKMSTDSHLFSKYVPLIYITLTQLQGNQYQLNAVNAGHEYGVIIKASGEVILLDQGGAPAGMDKDEKYIETQYSLDKNDTVFLFTDGCTDVKSPNGEVIGFDELLPILHQATQQHPKDIARYVRNRLQDFQGKAPQADDMTIVAVFVGDKLKNNA